MGHDQWQSYGIRADLMLSFPGIPLNGARMKTIVKAVLAACIGMLLLLPPHAAAQWVTYSMSGVVEQGRDDLNLFFGEPGETVFSAAQPMPCR